MNERTRFFGKILLLAFLSVAVAGALLLLGWVNERYGMEMQRECMSSLERPDPDFTDYEDNMLKFTEGVKECLS